MKTFKILTKVLSLLLIIAMAISIFAVLPVNVAAVEETRNPYGLNYLKIIDRFMSSNGQWEIIHYKDFYNVPGTIPANGVIPDEMMKQAADLYAPGTYYGTDKDIELPTEIDGYKMTVFAINLSKYVNKVTVPKSYVYFRGITGDSIQTVIFSREYKENEIQELTMFHFTNIPSLKKVVLPNPFPVGKIYTNGEGWHMGTTLELGTGNSGFFEGCTNLTEVVLPDNLMHIGLCCFKNCTSLKTLTLPNSLLNWGAGAFDNCNLEYVYAHTCFRYCKVLIIDEYTEKLKEQFSLYQNLPQIIVLNPTVKIAGDINGDEEYNINDVTILQQYLAEQVLFDIADKGDYNKDGKTTSKDALCMQLALADRYTPPLESCS